MANYSTKANVILTVNGKQAQQMLSQLEKDAKRLEQGIAKASTAGDKASMKKLQSELNATRRTMEQLRGTASTAEQVLARLDKATPKQLNTALRQLQQQLNGLQRGTAAWDAHVDKIRQVKAELQRVNSTMATQRSAWERMNVWLNNCQTAILGIGAAVSGLVMAGRKAVNTFAEMDEQLANTRKYTGMAAEDVEKLNAAFRKMDTRTPREKLNELAQEAGRLGKNTLESVQGYVEAADIINVALVDLGSGATQTIAKLTNIFGVEKMLGTRDAMLAVGSTVNVLSQNCTASKPYLVEFAQRMAGIGSQAGLTIPQILAFGAVLDANGQKVEMSATAIQKVIMNLANKNKEFAATLGLNAAKLNRVLKDSAKDGLLMFLEALQKMGQSVGFDNATMTLAPAFKEMGLDAARVSQVLSTLAMHLDEVKWQMGEADKAFREASSATNEYQIFNTTAQAAIDKAKKSVQELCVQLGQELYPIMKHIYTSSGVFLRVLNNLVTFTKSYYKEILVSVGALALARVAMVAYAARATIATAATKAFSVALMLGKSVLPAFRLLLVPLINTFYYFTNGLEVNYAMQQRWRVAMLQMKAMVSGALIPFRVAIIACTRGLNSARAAIRLFSASLSANPWGAVTLAIVAATAALIKYVTRSREGEEAQKRLSKQLAKTNSEITAEREEIDRLFHRLKTAEEGTNQYNKAKQKILDKYGQYLKGLGDEIEALNNVAEAYRIITTEATNAAKARGLEEANRETDKEFNTILEEQGKDINQGLRNAKRKVRYGNTTKEESLSKIEIADWTRTIIEEATQRRFSEETLEFLKSIGVYKDKNGVFRGDSKIAGAIGKITKGSLQHEDERSVNELIFGSPATNYENMSALEVRKVIAEFREVLDRNYSNGNQGASTILPNGKYVRLESNEDVHNEISALETLAKRLEEADEGVVVVARKKTGDVPDFGADTGKDRFAAEDEWKAAKSAEAMINAARGFKFGKNKKPRAYTSVDYSNDSLMIEEQYYKKILKRQDLTDTERLQMQAKYEEAKAKRAEAYNNNSIEKENEINKQRQRQIVEDYLQEVYTTEEYNSVLEAEEMRHQFALAEIYAKQSEEARKKKNFAKADELRELANNHEAKYLELSIPRRQRKEKTANDTENAKRAADKKVKDEFFGPSLAEREEAYASELEILERVYEQEFVLARSNKEELLRLEEAYQLARIAIAQKHGIKVGEETSNPVKAAIQKSADWLNSEGGKAFTQSFQTVTSGMSNIFSQLTAIVEAEVQQQTAAIENRYSAEINAAEGNSYRIAMLEKKKEEEIARVKKEANRKQFAMQVIQAVAQTAQNAISAYGSAAAIPVTGFVMAPIAAAMAVAAGMLQIAAIKKQQQASEAQGYSEGGFTPKGGKDEPVGVVHAGEWVASQKLVNNPRTRPLLEALDYAQRTNTIGSITKADVSRSITAPMLLASQPVAPSVVVQSAPQTVVVEQNSEYAATMQRLADRLDEPFVTVNTVSGDHGMQKAQDDYNKLMNNKKPKSRRK